jgi:hypothetical protein
VPALADETTIGAARPAKMAKAKTNLRISISFCLWESCSRFGRIAVAEARAAPQQLHSFGFS